MNRVTIGVICGVIFGLADVTMTLIGHHQGRDASMLMQAFTSRFAIGLLSTTVTLPLHPVLSGVIVGILISLPDSFGLHSYAGVLGTGLIFGALGGWAAKALAKSK